MKKRYLFLIALFSNLLCQAQSPQKWERDLSDSLSQIQKESGIVGFSVALVDQGGIRYTAGFGYADKNPPKEYGPRTVQTIASISKTFIGIALLKAQEEGKLNLDDPVNQYLPFKVFHPRFPDTPITLRHLATHTSGITDPKEYDEKGYVLFKNDNGDEVVYSDFRPAEEMLNLEEYQKRILSVDGEWYHKKTFMNKKPGTWFEYSNIGAGLAALVLEKATGVPFNTYTKAHIFEPLGMSDSGWFPDEINAECNRSIREPRMEDFKGEVLIYGIIQV